MRKFKKKVIITALILIIIIGEISYKLISRSKITETPKEEKKETLAMYIEDEAGIYQISNSKTFPTDGYVLDHAECKNGGTVIQDSETKKISAKFSHADSCNLYFSIEKCAESLLYPTTTLANGLKVYNSSISTYNECNASYMYTFDHEATAQMKNWTESERRDYRYIGNNPNNWIKFNNEDWRIIGIFTVEKKDGTKEQLMKIIRNVAANEEIQWSEDFKNEWSSSKLKSLLNDGDYYNRTNAYMSTGLTEKAREQIQEVKWYLGAANRYENIGGPAFYSFERGTTTCVTQNKCDGQSRSINTFAKVGLIYPSDYMYTYANGVDSICFENGSNCQSGNPRAGWLLRNFNQWTISPLSNATSLFGVGYNGMVGVAPFNYSFAIYPTVYLKSNIKITGGNGNQSNPYTIE